MKIRARLLCKDKYVNFVKRDDLGIKLPRFLILNIPCKAVGAKTNSNFIAVHYKKHVPGIVHNFNSRL
jgi:hypothetical protein